MVNNSLAVINGSEWSGMVQVAEALVSSGFLPQSVNTPQKAVAIILAGRELGIGPWQALQTINVIQGKPTVSPQLMLALINQSGQLEDIVIDGDGKGCVVMMKRKGRQPHTETFTLEDATKLGLSGKDNYRKQPAIMLRWRAVAACARVVFPDVILGLYTPDEMGADVETDDSGAMTVITVERDTTPPQLSENAPAPAQTQGKPASNVTPITTAQMGNTHGPIKGEEPKAATQDGGDLRDKETASRFIQRWRSQALTDSEVLAALGVTKLSEWQNGRKAADDAVNAWLAGKVNGGEQRDWDFIWSEVSDFYKADGDEKKARDHFAYGTVEKLTKAGVITDAMSDAQVIAKITAYKQGTPVEELKQFEAVAFA